MRDLDLGNGAIVPADALRTATSRSGGPGGQNVNKVETRVTVAVDVATLPLSDEQKERVRTRLATRINRDGELHVTSQSERTQLANRDRALARLEDLLREALTEPKPRRRTKPTKASREKRLEGKKRRSDTKRLRRRV
ncbi:MAG TPA: alternative ribosome rescue aminoacyl-tRNA hydrolase ArfB [Thermoanaerobaculia bacterium]